MKYTDEEFTPAIVLETSRTKQMTLSFFWSSEKEGGLIRLLLVNGRSFSKSVEFLITSHVLL